MAQEGEGKLYEPIAVLRFIANYGKVAGRGAHGSAIRAIFTLLDRMEEGCSPTYLMETAAMDRNVAGNVCQALTELGHAKLMGVFGEGLRGRPPQLFRAATSLEVVGVGYNELTVDLIYAYMGGDISRTMIRRRSLGMFAIGHGVRLRGFGHEDSPTFGGPGIDMQLDVGMHPLSIMHRSLEGFAAVHGIQEAIHNDVRNFIKYPPSD